MFFIHKLIHCFTILHLPVEGITFPISTTLPSYTTLLQYCYCFNTKLILQLHVYPPYHKLITNKIITNSNHLPIIATHCLLSTYQNFLAWASWSFTNISAPYYLVQHLITSTAKPTICSSHQPSVAPLLATISNCLNSIYKFQLPSFTSTSQHRILITYTYKPPYTYIALNLISSQQPNCPHTKKNFTWKLSHTSAIPLNERHPLTRLRDLTQKFAKPESNNLPCLLRN